MSSPLSFKYHQLCWVLPKFLFFPFISYLLLRYAAFRKTPQRCCSCKQLSTCLFAFLQAEDLSSGACCDLRATQKKNHSQAHCVSFTIIWRSYDSWVLCIPVSEQSGLFFFMKSPLPSNYKLPHQKSPTDRSTVLRELDLRLIIYLPLCLIMSLCYPDYNNLVIIKKE